MKPSLKIAFTIATTSSFRIHYIFTTDINVFKLHAYTVCLIECFATIQQLLPISWPLLLKYAAVNAPLVILKHYMIVCSSTAVLTYAVKLDASDVISEVFSDWSMGSKMLALKTRHFLSHNQSENWNKYSRWANSIVFPSCLHQRSKGCHTAPGA